MESFILNENIEVVFLKATIFPEDVPTTYEKLKALLPDKPHRRYFGISHPDHTGKIQYKAAAEILVDDAIFNTELQKFTIEKGSFAAQYIVNHFKDSNSIGDCFQKLIKHPQIDPKGYCLELYKNYDDLDVHCMVRLKAR
jgi:hypothetical protein